MILTLSKNFLHKKGRAQPFFYDETQSSHLYDKPIFYLQLSKLFQFFLKYFFDVLWMNPPLI